MLTGHKRTSPINCLGLTSPRRPATRRSRLVCCVHLYHDFGCFPVYAVNKMVGICAYFPHESWKNMCALNMLLLAIFMQCALFSLSEQDISYTRLQYIVVYLCTNSSL